MRRFARYLLGASCKCAMLAVASHMAVLPSGGLE